MKLHVCCVVFCHIVHLAWSLEDVDPPITKEEFERAAMKLYHFSESDVIEETSRPKVPCSMPPTFAKTKSFVASVPNRWPNGILPYSLAAGLPQTARDAVALAITEIMDNTCVKIRARTNEDQDYVHIGSNDTGCYASWLGFRIGTGPLLVNLQTPGCDSHSTAVHELIHALGGTHEQNRPDRDEHLVIHWENIVPHGRFQYVRLQNTSDAQKLPACKVGDASFQNCVAGTLKSRTFGLPYDPLSVMHYGRTDFAIDRVKDTMTPKDSDVDILGNNMGMTVVDIRKLRAAYGCDMHSGTSSTMHVSGMGSTIFRESVEDGSLVLISGSSASQILIDFTALALEGSDSITIRDGSSQTSPVLAQITSGTALEVVVISSGSQVFLEFRLEDSQSPFVLKWQSVGGSCCKSFRFDMPRDSFVATNSFMKNFLGQYTITRETTTRAGREFPVFRKDPDHVFSIVNDTDQSFSWVINTSPGNSRGFFFFTGSDCPLEAGEMKFARDIMLENAPEFTLTCQVDCGTPPSAQSLKAISVSSGNSTFRSTLLYQCSDNTRLIAVCEGPGAWKMAGKAICEESTSLSERDPEELTLTTCGGFIPNRMPKDNITIAYPKDGSYERNRACVWSLKTTGRFKVELKAIHLQITSSCVSHRVTLGKMPGSIRFCGYGSNITDHEYFTRGKDLEVSFMPDSSQYTSPVFSIRIEVIP